MGAADFVDDSGEMFQSTESGAHPEMGTKDVRLPTMTVAILDGRYVGALAYTLRTALVRPARIEVVHAHGTPTPANLPVDAAEIFGGPAESLTEASKSSDVLVVQSPEGTLDRITDPVLKRLRSSTRCLLLEVDQDGEIVRASGPLSWIVEEGITKPAAPDRSPIVTVGVDSSSASATVVGWAANEALRRGATLRLVAVHPRGDSAEVAEQALRAACAQTAGAVIEVVVAAGEPIDVLVEKSRDSELLVVGAHGTSGLIHSAMGGVGDSCARLAACPVVIVPVNARDPQVGTDHTTLVPPSAA